VKIALPVLVRVQAEQVAAAVVLQGIDGKKDRFAGGVGSLPRVFAALADGGIQFHGYGSFHMLTLRRLGILALLCVFVVFIVAGLRSRFITGPSFVGLHARTVLVGCSLSARTGLLLARTPLFNARSSRRIHIQQAAHLRPSVVFAVEQKLVNEALAAPAVVRQDVFHVLELGQVRPDLELGPATEAAHVTAAKETNVRRQLFLLATLVHHCTQEDQQAARLRRQFVERAAQHFVRDLVRRFDVRILDLDVLQPVVLLQRPLILVKQGNTPDQR